MDIYNTNKNATTKVISNNLFVAIESKDKDSFGNNNNYDKLN